MENSLMVKVLVILMIFNLGLTFYLVTQLTDVNADISNLKSKVEEQNLIEIPGILEKKDVVFSEITATGLVEQMEMTRDEIQDKYEVKFEVYNPDDVFWCGDGEIKKVLHTAEPDSEDVVIQKTGYSIELVSSNCEDKLTNVTIKVPYPENFRCNQSTLSENLDDILTTTNNARLIGLMEYESGKGRYIHTIDELQNPLNSREYIVTCDNDTGEIILEAQKVTEWLPE